ncbi:enoyl-CoA hydratase/isomerase family protein [Candidatus Puniceispirillum sp.]|nr:enoyl-CoA hydratase/isomerase family protein [Candidatus Puniceispirillum sp.]
MPQAHIHFDVINGAGLVTLDRPKALNALTVEMVTDLRQFLLNWRDDPVISHVVIASSAPRAFCAGGDIRQARETIIASGFDEADAFFRGEYLVDLAIAEFGKPIIAICDGVVMGGGAGLAEHCSHIIMSEATRFAMPETSIGLFPDVGASLFLGRCPLPVARLLGMTGYTIHGADCMMLGLATSMVASSQMAGLKKSLLNCTASEIDKVIAKFKMDPGVPTLNQHMLVIERIFGGDATPEQMQERAEDLALMRPNDKLVSYVVTAFTTRCPVSIKLFWRLLQMGDAITDIGAALTLDYHLAMRMIRRADYVEGVRAVLVDRDNAPKWSPNSLALVDKALLDTIFDEDGLSPLC